MEIRIELDQLIFIIILFTEELYHMINIDFIN
jgi:hypothetical protein